MRDSAAKSLLADSESAKQPLVSVVLPCLDEEETIGACIKKIQETFARHQIDGEIIVCDNGSTDASISIAQALGAVVVHEPIRGYGHAYLTAFKAARGVYLIMGDADDTYDFALIPQFLNDLTIGGYEFVTGSRYLSGHSAGHSAGQLDEIPFLHRFLGNPVLTRLLNLCFGTSYTDVYCGIRGFSREAYDRIQPISSGMEFNLELAINAKLKKLKIREIPVRLGPRKGISKLHTVYDGLRSLRLIMMKKIFPGHYLHDRKSMKITKILIALLPVLLIGTFALGHHYLKIQRDRGAQMLQSGDIDAALELSLKLRKWDPKYSGYAIDYARAVFQNSRFTDERKIEVLDHYHANSPVFSYFMAILYSRQGDFNKAYSLLEADLENPAKFVSETQQDIESVAGDVFAICLKAQGMSCREQVYKIKNHFKARPWNEGAFRARLGVLGVQQF